MGWIFDRLYGALRPQGPVQVDHLDFKMWMDPGDDGVATQILVNDAYEPGVTALMRELLAPGMTMIDIGANFGYFTMIASRRVGPDGRVLAFEPEPKNRDLLMKNVEANQLTNVTVDGRALSRSEGTTSLFLDDHNLGSHSLRADNVFHGESAIEIQTTTLGSALRELGKADVIKMDVQGAEGLVIEGGREDLASWRGAIVIEFWPFGLRNFETDPLEFLQQFVDWGFELQLIDDASGETSAVNVEEAIAQAEATHGGQGHVNLLIARPSAASR